MMYNIYIKKQRNGKNKMKKETENTVIELLNKHTSIDNDILEQEKENKIIDNNLISVPPYIINEILALFQDIDKKYLKGDYLLVKITNNFNKVLNKHYSKQKSAHITCCLQQIISSLTEEEFYCKSIGDIFKVRMLPKIKSAIRDAI